MTIRKGMKRAFLIVAILVFSPLIYDSDALATSYTLKETIDMTGYDILNIGSDGTNLLVLNNASPDTIEIVDLTGTNLNGFNTPSNFNSGVTFNGSMIVFANGTSASHKYLREMNPSNGSTSGYLSSDLGSVMGLGFDGSNILVSYYASGANGVLTSVITQIDAITYQVAGTLSVTVDTGTNISATPTYGVAWHNDNLFVAFQAVDKVYQFDSDLDLIEEIPIITEWPRGITFIGDDLFVADRGAQKIYRYEPVEILAADVDTLSESTGGEVNFTLAAGTEYAGRNYFLLGSATGTTPGFPLPGGQTLPLNWDVFTGLVFKMANTPVLVDFYGVLDPSGQAAAKMDTFGPLPPGSAGITLYFAYTLYGPFGLVSNPVAVEIVP